MAGLLDPSTSANAAPVYDFGITELWSPVAPGLWQGGTHDDDTINAQLTYHEMVRGERQVTAELFDAVVTMYAWARPADWGVKELRFTFGDGLHVPDDDDVFDVVQWAHKHWSNGQRVLVRCQAGLNRSGYIAALMLIRSGMAPSDAVKLLRESRSRWVLFNDAFERAVLGADVDFWRKP
jgi:Dual specificity phosphatase, catalytic domain